LRTLFVVVTVCAIPLAWAGYGLKWVRERKEIHDMSAECSSRECKSSADHLPLTLRILGDSPVGWIAVGSGFKEAEVDRIKSLFPEATIVRDKGHPDQIFVSLAFLGPPFAGGAQR
jgi:hypothetical protein